MGIYNCQWGLYLAILCIFRYHRNQMVDVSIVHLTDVAYV